MACPVICTSEIVSVAQREKVISARRSSKRSGKVGSVVCFPLFHSAGKLRSATLPVASIDQVSTAGFSEPIKLAELRGTRYVSVPAHAGIYLIERETEGASEFRISSTGGWFRGQDPNCAPDIVRANG